MKLAARGVLLSFVPFALTLGVSVSLLFLINQEDRCLAREIAARQLLAEVNDLPFQCFNAGIALTAFRMTRPKQWIKTFNQHADNAHKVMQNLREATFVAPDHSAITLSINKNAESFLNELFLYERNISNPNRTMGSIPKDQIKKNLQSSLFFMMNDINKLNNLQSKEIDQEIAQWQIWTNYTGVIIGSCIAVSVLLCLLSSLFFIRSICSRLDIIGDNFDRLSTNKPLLPQSLAGDELSLVDAKFHEMAGALRLAQQQKQQLRVLLRESLREPLCGISNLLQECSEGSLLKLDEAGEVRIKHSIETIRNVNRLIDELSIVDELKTGEIILHTERIDLKELVKQSIQIVEAFAIRRGITFKINFEYLGLVCADQQKIIQVLYNLLTNACKYAPANTAVSITVREFNSKEVRISVQDCGLNLSADDKEKLFKKFEQTDIAHIKQGSGLGLAISRAIVEQHGGRMDVDINDSEGTTFWFTLLKDDRAAG